MNKKYKITKILIRENKILILIVKRKKKYKIKKIIIKMNKKNKIIFKKNFLKINSKKKMEISNFLNFGKYHLELEKYYT